MSIPAELIAVPDGATPASYTLSPNEELHVEAASAVFDGTGAAGAFLPAIAIYAPSGQLISKTFPDTSIAAGSSAEVTFAPF